MLIFWGVYVGDQENQGVNQNEIKEIMMEIYRNIDFKGKIMIIIELKNLNDGENGNYVVNQCRN